MKPINLAIIEDDKNIKSSLENYMSEMDEITISISEESVEDFLKRLEVSNLPKVDVLLLDIGLPGMTGLEGIKFIKQKLPNVNIIMLTTFEEEDKIFKALCAGAVSYLTKRTSLSKIFEAITIINKGGSFMSPTIARKVINHFAPKPKSLESPFTPRQKQIIEGILDGLSYKMIADKYLISIDTVRDHIKKIYRLLEINSKGELIKRVTDDGLIN